MWAVPLAGRMPEPRARWAQHEELPRRRIPGSACRRRFAITIARRSSSSSSVTTTSPERRSAPRTWSASFRRTSRATWTRCVKREGSPCWSRRSRAAASAPKARSTTTWLRGPRRRGALPGKSTSRSSIFMRTAGQWYRAWAPWPRTLSRWHRRPRKTLITPTWDRRARRSSPGWWRAGSRTTFPCSPRISPWVRSSRRDASRGRSSPPRRLAITHIAPCWVTGIHWAMRARRARPTSSWKEPVSRTRWMRPWRKAGPRASPSS